MRRPRCGILAVVSTALVPIMLSGCMSSTEMMVATQNSLQAAPAQNSPPAGSSTEVAGSADFAIPADGVPLAVETAGDLPPNLNYLPTPRPGDAASAVAFAPVPAQPAAPQQSLAPTAGTTAAVDPAAAFPGTPPVPGMAPQPEAVAAAAPATMPAPAERPAAVDPAAATQPQQPVHFVENAPPPAPIEQKRNRFLSSLFGGGEPARPPAALSSYSSAPQTARAAVDAPIEAPVLASVSPRSGSEPMANLPGVRTTALFEVRRSSGSPDDVGDVDLHEDDEDDSIRLASAAGLARLAPNGLMKQTDNVEVTCLKPALVRVMNAIERHYGQKPVVTSGYRNPIRNSRARGARNSLHMFCAAADIQVPGVSKWELAQFARTMPGRGGVGTYCHTDSVHIDIGPERDWNWRCRRRR